MHDFHYGSHIQSPHNINDYMNCHGCIYAKPVEELDEDIPMELLYEDVVYCTFLEEFVVQDNEECAYKRTIG